jgi:hypothetical protein
VLIGQNKFEVSVKMGLKNMKKKNEWFLGFHNNKGYATLLLWKTLFHD